MVVGFLMSGGFALFFMGIRRASPSSAAIVGQLGLVITTLLSVAMLGEQIGWRRGLGIVLTFVGGMLVMWNPSSGFPQSSILSARTPSGMRCPGIAHPSSDAAFNNVVATKVRRSPSGTSRT
jgi:drug/metabolite transporter (DMT)-like permease